jgi:hypothetical protein
MNEANGFAVFFFPQALEALGEAIKPYLQDGPAGDHVVCNEIDTSGALVEMTMRGTTKDGQPVALELMVPTAMAASASARATSRPLPRACCRRSAQPPSLPTHGPPRCRTAAPSRQFPPRAPHPTRAPVRPDRGNEA